MTILIIDNQPFICNSLSMLIAQHQPESVIKYASDIQSALPLLKNEEFNLVIAEVDLTADVGFGLIEVIRRQQRQVRILIYSTLEEDVFAIPLLKAGANGFLAKKADEAEILRAIQIVLFKGRYLSINLQNKLLAKMSRKPDGNSLVDPLGSLSRREMAVVQLIFRGKINKEIAHTLGVQPNTVSTIKQRAFAKLKVTTPLELYQVLTLLSH